MDTLCRLCSIKTPALTSIFSFKNDRLISDMISIICPIKIDAADDFPKNICKACLRIISEAYELREKSVQSDVNFKTGKFEKQESLPKISEVAHIKEEKDPFNSAILFLDENFAGQEDEKNESNGSENYEDDYDEADDDEDYYEQITPVEPNIGNKRIKYERTSINKGEKFKCPFCEKTFNHRSNVKRHILYDHENKKPKKDKKERKNDIGPKDNSVTCNICGTFISHKQNFKRHIKMHHPADYVPSTFGRLQSIIEGSSELTKKFFATPKKQKYMEYINIVSLESDNCYKYQCLLCIKEHSQSKVWSQNVNNGGTSNIRRHLSTHHHDAFKRLEAIEATEGFE